MDKFIKTLEETNFKLLSSDNPQTLFDANDVNRLFEELGYKPNVKNGCSPASLESGSNMILVTMYMNLMLTKKVESLEEDLRFLKVQLEVES